MVATVLLRKTVDPCPSTGNHERHWPDRPELTPVAEPPLRANSGILGSGNAAPWPHNLPAARFSRGFCQRHLVQSVSKPIVGLSFVLRPPGRLAHAFTSHGESDSAPARARPSW